MSVLEIKVGLDPEGTLERLLDSGAAEIYRRFNKHLRDKTASRYIFASQVTRYAQSTIGSRQSYTQRVRGVTPPEGALYGIDEGELFREATENLKFTSEGALLVETDLEYDLYIFNLIEEKGPFEEGLFFVDEDDLQFLENQIVDRIEEELED